MTAVEIAANLTRVSSYSLQKTPKGQQFRQFYDSDNLTLFQYEFGERCLVFKEPCGIMTGLAQVGKGT